MVTVGQTILFWIQCEQVGNQSPVAVDGCVLKRKRRNMFKRRFG